MVPSIALAKEGLDSKPLFRATDGRPAMYYTYILESDKNLGKRFIGHTSDLKQRLREHNSGRCDATS
jgi:hypothetical protein